MMLPNQITSQTFSPTGKNGYKADEVKAFLQRVFQSYNKLYYENKALSDKLDETVPKLEEYEKTKSKIADALIWAKSTAEQNIEEAKGIAEKTISDAKYKAEKHYEETKAKADAYYADKTVAANENLEKARAEFENLKKQSELYSDRYIAEINVKAQTIIEDANSKSASIVAAAYSDARAAREKADKIIADANSELQRLQAEAINIKEQILALISFAETAAGKIDVSVFEEFAAPASSVNQDIQAKTIDTETIEQFSFDGMQNINVEDVEAVVEEAPEEPEQQSFQQNASVQPGYVRFFGADIPDVNDILSGIFTAASESAAEEGEENSFRFEKVVSDFDRPKANAFAVEDNYDENEPFSFLRKDSE